MESLGNKGSPLTFEERKQIEKFISEGHSLSSISLLIERGKNTVIVEVRKHGGPKKYKAIIAHEDALKRKRERDEKCRKANKKTQFNPFVTLQRRIENLEMQVEILVDTIKEIRKT